MLGLRRFAGISLLLFAVTLVLFPPRVNAATLTVDDDGVDCPGAGFTTVSGAVAAAIAGDTIEVCNGTYTEQVVINKSLTLKAKPTHTPSVVAPAVMSGSQAIITVTGSGVNATVDGLIISGPGGGGCNTLRYGIRVEGGANATIKNNLIKDIRDNPFSGCQNGVGILVGRQFEATTGTATIYDNVIQGYQKGGIVVDNTGSSAVITDNIVTGAGRTETIAQNGIQVSRGAVVTPANLHGNTVSGNFYLNSSAPTFPAVATGILYFQSGAPGFPGPLNSTNKLRHNQVNVLVIP